MRFPARIDVDEPALLRGHLEQRLEELLAGGRSPRSRASSCRRPRSAGARSRQARRREWKASGITMRLEAALVARPAARDRLRHVHGGDQEPRPPAPLAGRRAGLPGDGPGDAERHGQHQHGNDDEGIRRAARARSARGCRRGRARRRVEDRGEAAAIAEREDPPLEAQHQERPPDLRRRVDRLEEAGAEDAVVDDRLADLQAEARRGCRCGPSRRGRRGSRGTSPGACASAGPRPRRSRAAASGRP